MTEPRDPYTAAQPKIGPTTGSTSGRVGWKVYGLGVVIFQIIGLVYDLRTPQLMEVMDDLVTMVGMVGLLGYVFQKRVGWRSLWRLWAVLFPVSNALIGLWVYPRVGTGGYLGYFAAMLLFFPQYLAVFRYGYRSPEIWRGMARGGGC